MKTYNHLWEKLLNFDNLIAAYCKAMEHKSSNPVVEEFSLNWRMNLCLLLHELSNKIYKPYPLVTFVLRDPKTRIICKSHFRDRVVHHALVNVLQPIFEPRFIEDSYASRKGKGTSTALEKFSLFLRKVSSNGRLVHGETNSNYIVGYALKCDIKHYFESVDHEVLLQIISKYVKDDSILWLVKTILANYDSGTPGKGMPLGNWTSQFFANIYLNELDQFVKHTLRAKYYLRYVDDFVIMHRSKSVLQEYNNSIQMILNKLKLDIHPDKCKIIPLSHGVSFLGFRVSYHYKRIRERNQQKIKARLKLLLEKYKRNIISYYEIVDVWTGWSAYAKQGNSYNLCQKMEIQLIGELSEIKNFKRITNR